MPGRNLFTDQAAIGVNVAGHDLGFHGERKNLIMDANGKLKCLKHKSEYDVPF